MGSVVWVLSSAVVPVEDVASEAPPLLVLVGAASVVGALVEPSPDPELEPSVSPTELFLGGQPSAMRAARREIKFEDRLRIRP